MERKVKYSYEFKLRCVMEVLKKHRSAGSVAMANGFDGSNLRKWISVYNQFGSAGLLPRMNQKYSADFKMKVLLHLEKKSLSLKEACLKFNIPSSSVVIQWQRSYARDGSAGLITKPRGRPPMNFKRAKKKSDKPLTREEELLKENEALRAENALLKKFNALIQAEELQQKQKRKP